MVKRDEIVDAEADIGQVDVGCGGEQKSGRDPDRPRSGSAPQGDEQQRQCQRRIGHRGERQRSGDDDHERSKPRSEEPTSEIPYLMRNSYAVLRLKKKNKTT